jgi:hypothetical protein
MKQFNFLFTLLFLSLLMASCDNDPCDDGYTEIDNGACIPDYVVGIEQNSELGNMFYHLKFGAITFKNGNWHDESDLIINISIVPD